MSLAWLVLILSGALEAVWATALAASNGFRRPIPVVVFLVSMIVSLLGLAYGLKEIPVGTGYAVWVGVGATLTAAWSILRGRERANTAKLLLLGGLVACVVGLQLVSSL